MATRSRSASEAPAPVEDSAPAAAEAPASPAPAAKPFGFNLPRIVAKAPKAVEPVAEKIVYAAGESITLSGVSRQAPASVEKPAPVIHDLRKLGR